MIDQRLTNAFVVASISGGKDSTALCLWLREQDIEHRRVFADTGWEAPETYAHLDYLRAVLGPIDVVQSKHGGMQDLVRKKGMFPSRVRRFCTSELKGKPLDAYHEQIRDAEGLDTISAVGIRAGESKARANLEEWEWAEDRDMWVWRPLIAWTEDQVIDIHRRHGVRPNPLYLAGAERVGCWPCIYARKAEIALVAKRSPDRIAEIAALEAEADSAQLARDAAKGRTRAETGHHAPTYFSGTAPADATGKRAWISLPIVDAVKWATRDDDPAQGLLFGADPHPGCARWGLCETEP